MNGIKAKLEALQRTRPGLFVKKLMDDQVPNLAALLAWGTLSALLPMMLGILGLAGLVLTNPEQLDRVYSTLAALVPTQSAELTQALEGVREQLRALLELVFSCCSSTARHSSPIWHRCSIRRITSKAAISSCSAWYRSSC